MSFGRLISGGAIDESIASQLIYRGPVDQLEDYFLVFCLAQRQAVCRLMAVV